MLFFIIINYIINSAKGWYLFEFIKKKIGRSHK